MPHVILLYQTVVSKLTLYKGFKTLRGLGLTSPMCQECAEMQDGYRWGSAILVKCWSATNLLKDGDEPGSSSHKMSGWPGELTSV